MNVLESFSLCRFFISLRIYESEFDKGGKECGMSMSHFIVNERYHATYKNVGEVDSLNGSHYLEGLYIIHFLGINFLIYTEDALYNIIYRCCILFILYKGYPRIY
jgi:hypothetical protein